MACSSPSAVMGENWNAGRDFCLQRGVVGVDDGVGEATGTRNDRQAAIA